MATSTSTNLGALNLLAASVTVQAYSALSINAASLAEEGIKIAPEGDATEFIKMLAGVTPSPQPYMMMTVTIAVAKTLTIAAAYQAQFQQNTVLGQVTIRPDVSRGSGGLQPFVLQNAALMSPGSMGFNGKENVFGVTVRGQWNVNAALWNGLSSLANS